MPPSRPRKPRDNAGASAWEAYWKQMELFEQAREYERQVRREQRQLARQQQRQGRGPRENGWVPSHNGYVDGQPAEVRQGETGRTKRIDAYWPAGDPKYGHLVSNDGLNANFVRNPGEDEPVVDDRRAEP